VQLALLGRDARQSRTLAFSDPTGIDALDALVVRSGCCLQEFAGQVEEHSADGLPQLGLRGSEAFLARLRAWREIIAPWVAEGGLLVVGVAPPGRVLVHTVEKVVEVDVAGRLAPQGGLQLAPLPPATAAAATAGEPWRSFLAPLLGGLAPHHALAARGATPLVTSGEAAIALQSPAGAGQIVHLPLPDGAWSDTALDAVAALAERLLRARPGALPRWVGLTTAAGDGALRESLAQAEAAAAAAREQVAALRGQLRSRRRAWRLAFVRGRELWEATADVFQAAGAAALQGESPDEDLLVEWDGGSAAVAICERPDRLEARAAELAAEGPGGLLIVATEQFVPPAQRHPPGDDRRLAETAAALGVHLVTPLDLLALTASEGAAACLGLLGPAGRTEPLPDWRTVLVIEPA